MLRKLFLLLSLMWFISGCNENQNDCSAIQQAAQAELQVHPQAGLTDLYKFFFQDAFGPGHMIPNTEFAEEYLNQELAGATEFDSLLFQPVGVAHNYYRVNLKLVAQGVLPADSLLRAFVESANAAHPPTLHEWKTEWKAILSCIESMNLNLPGFVKDKQHIAQRLAQGKFIGHHSEAYISAYHPHYRIVSKYHFEKLRRHLIEQSLHK